MKAGKLLLIFIPLVFLLVAQPVAAATLKGGEDVSIAKEEIMNDDLYIGGGNITVLGSITEDLISAGGNVLINGGVGVDAILAGGSIQVLSPVGDDVRAAGGQIVIGDSIGGDAFLAGGDVKLLSSSSVGGDVVIAGGRVVLDGAMLGDVQVWADEVIINGAVSGNVSIKGTRVTIGDTARIAGNLTYSAVQAATVGENATVSGVITFDQKQRVKEKKPGAGALLALGGALLFGKLVIMLLTVLLLVLLFPKFARTISTEVLENYGKNSLLGFATLILTPIALLLIAFTFFGLLISGVGFLVYVLAILLTKVFAGVAAGAILSKMVKKEIIVDWKWALLGVVVVQVIALIPFAGWIITNILFLVTFGALVSVCHKHFWIER